jgi:SOS-response transcriptional repressor LexA
VAQVNQEVIGLLMRKEEQEVLEDNIVTPRDISIREHTKNQVHPLSGSIRGLGWMSYEEK